MELARQVHASVAKSAEVCSDVFVLNSLMDMYFKCGKSEDGISVFGAMEKKDSISWNIMMAGLVNAGELRMARKVFDEMPQRDVVSWNTLVSAHAKAGEMEIARELFDQMPERSLVSWNALISGYSQNGKHDEALLVFSRMLEAGMKPDCTTILSVLSACASVQSPDVVLVEKIICLAKSMTSTQISTALLSLYAKIGRIDDARRVFDGIHDKDLIAWNAMIAGYSQNQRPAQAIELFRSMQGVRPDGMTMVSLIDACSQTGVLSQGEQIHTFIQENKIQSDIFLTTALIDMYAKCGDLNCSRRLFLEMQEKHLTSWNAMINALAIHGKGNEALNLFSSMEKNGIMPNDITYIGLLNACSHAGLVDEGLKLFKSMQRQYNIVPRLEHYGCVIDLLGRAGRLKEAYKFIKIMPIKPDSVVWAALLAACRNQHDVELAEEAAGQLLQLDSRHDGNYVLLSNVYASQGKWEDVENVRAQMREHNVKKVPGCSTVEIDGVLHEFTAGDKLHPRSDEIYAAIDALMEKLKLKGYKPDTGALLRNLDEEEKEEALYGHSEKLAMCFALISSKKGKLFPIRIVKNLRICSDCHRVMELVSELEEREIIVRDRNRFHHFHGGSCSCMGYW